VSPDIVVDKLLPLALKNLKDPVPNIRFISVKVAKSLQKRIEAQSAINQIKQYRIDLFF
jgi:serine/threonine-protein phosphatase 2A regulatory subunit A